MYMKKTYLSALAAVFVAFAMCTSVAYGQISTASIVGTVTDPQGAVIPGAELVLMNVATGVGTRTQTNATGNYRIQNIQVGTYTLSAVADGFTTKQLEPFTLTVNQTATFDFSLAVGAVAETVTVEATGAQVQSASSELGQVVEEKQVKDLPLNGRNFTQMLMLQPGVVMTLPPGSQSMSKTRAIGEASNPSVNGQNNRANVFMLDGVANLETFGNAYAVPPIVDAIQEFKVQSHNDSADVGMGSGGTVNVVTKSGTNEIHGTAWYFGKNDAFNARQFNRTTIDPFRQHQYGGTVGGPIIKNKTFFFGGFQGFRFSQPGASFFNVPTQAMLNGDFSAVGRDIFDPLTTRENPDTGAMIRDPFAGNQIPGARIDQNILRYLQVTNLPSPTVTERPQFNAVDNLPRTIAQEEWQFKINHNFNQNNMAWFRLSQLDQRDDGSAGRPGLVRSQGMEAINFAGSWVHILDPTSTLQIQFGRSVVETPDLREFEGLDNEQVAAETGFPRETFQFGDEALLTGLSAARYFGGSPFLGVRRPADNWQLKGDYTKIFGNHTIKAGGDFISATMRQTFKSHTVTFTEFETADLANSATTGDSVASMLLNVANTSSRRNILETLRFGGNLGLFIQDTWKATQKLTVNLGLRFDHAWVPQYGTVEDGNIFTGNANTDTGQFAILQTPPPCSQIGRAPCIPTPDGSLPENVISVDGGTLIPGRGAMFGPRVGLAYRLTNKTALRASGGIVYDTWAGIYQSSRGIGGNWPDVSVTRFGNLNNPTPSNPFPGITAQDPSLGASAVPAPDPFNVQWWFVDPNFEQAYSMQWNFGVQHQVAQATVLELNYVGSGSRDTSLGAQRNTAVVPGPGDPRDRMRFPHMRPTFFEKSIGRSNYHSLQFALKRSFSKGLSMTIAYTWAKAIDIACSGFFGTEGCAVQNEHNLDNDRSVSAFDVPHNLVVSWVYELPVGRGKLLHVENGVLNKIVGGWQFNGLVNVRNGLPYHVTVPGDIANVFNTGTFMRADLVGEPELSNPTPERWINTDAFAAPAPFTFGNLGRNTLRPDSVARFDLSLFKDIPIKERVTVQLRFEAFNAFNSTNFNKPDSNLASPRFGLVTSTQVPPRQLQLGGKIIF